MIPYEAATAISSGDEIHMKSKSLSGNLFRSRSALFGMKSHKGFTLIELLVVVAIIGILASVVLAALGSARSKASDAKIKAELSNVRAQAELFSSSQVNSGYGSLAGNSCTTGSLFVDPGMAKFVGASGSLTAVTTVTCGSNSQSWAVSAKLFNTIGVNTAWCVDSNGSSKAIPSLIANGGLACP